MEVTNFKVDEIRKDFPFLEYIIPLIYFDNAATSQKPQSVIDAISYYYAFQNAPVHRGIYKQAESITKLYEESRSTVADFIGANYDEVVFTKGTTEGINFIASTWADSNLNEGDEIVLTELEHHANVLPWIHLAQRKKLVLRYVPITEDFNLDYDAFLKLLNERTKLVAFTACSNALGTYINVPFIIENAHKIGAKVLVDAAQSVCHRKLNVHKIDPDFLVFSAHKMLGPTGIGVLYISRKMHPYVEPYQFGGGMVFEVSCFDASWLKTPNCYEAGTPPIAQAIGLGAAIRYIQKKVDYNLLRKHEAGLCKTLINGLESINGLRILGPIEQLCNEGHIVSFIHDKMHSHDITAYLDSYNIAVRAGNHCAQPLYTKLGISGSVRASFYLYNTLEEVDFLINILKKLFK